jgi:hypothetical protein
MGATCHQIYMVSNKLFVETQLKLDVYGSVHHNTNLTEMTNMMQLYKTIYYFIVPWLLNIFRAILSLTIRSF